ncbi:MAG: hypothetical protein RDV48_11690 [Candidatus Eremiobacteraeota bacterium]|nr:hypothetical protein [Candidatus Eremiobacteraeota bacterium]
MTPQQIAQKAISIMNKRITNEIFLIIQNNQNLMYEYLKAVEDKGIDNINQSIGKEVKSAYYLKNINDREENPSCTLIQSHQKFE